MRQGITVVAFLLIDWLNTCNFPLGGKHTGKRVTDWEWREQHTRIEDGTADHPGRTLSYWRDLEEIWKKRLRWSAERHTKKKSGEDRGGQQQRGTALQTSWRALKGITLEKNSDKALTDTSKICSVHALIDTRRTASLQYLTVGP